MTQPDPGVEALDLAAADGPELAYGVGLERHGQRVNGGHVLEAVLDV